MRLLRIIDIAREAGVSVDTARCWVRYGRLPSYRPGRHRLVRREDFDAFLARNPRGVTTPETSASRR